MNVLSRNVQSSFKVQKQKLRVCTIRIILNKKALSINFTFMQEGGMSLFFSRYQIILNISNEKLWTKKQTFDVIGLLI